MVLVWYKRKHNRPLLHVLVKTSLFCLGIILAVSTLQAQDVEQILKEKKVVKVSGGFAANTTLYHANGIANRRDPFYWLLSANMNLSILDIIQAPFSVTLSQQSKRFSQPQPFNRFGISPRYKSVTAHLGHRTMNFSEYTLAGHMFLGAGVDVAPPDGFIRFSAMYGRLAKAVERSAQEGLVFAKPTFRRMGYGMKVGLGRKKHIVDLIFFKGEDDEHSIPITDELEVTPEENLVLGFHSRHELGERIYVELEYAYSLFTRDKRSIRAEEYGYSFVNNLGGLFRPNQSSEFNDAFTTSLVYNGNAYQANIKYRKVDPGYRTLGSSFLNNGMEDITGGLSWNMFANVLTISANAGMQQTLKEQSVTRMIYAVNVNYTASQRLNLSTGYSNFATTTRQLQLQRDVLIDTLEYFQVTRSATLNTNYRLGRDDRAVTIILAANVQDATDRAAAQSTFYSFTLGEQMNLGGQWQVGLSGAYNRNQSAAFENTSMGPMLNVSSVFREGMIRSSLAGAWLSTYVGKHKQSEVFNASVTNSIRVAKKHAVSINLYYLSNQEIGELGKKFSEVRGMVNYNYSF